MIKWAWLFLCRAARAAPAFLLDLAWCTCIYAGVYEWQIAVWYPNNVRDGEGGPLQSYKSVVKITRPPPLPSQQWWIGFNIEWKAKMRLVIKQRNRELWPNLFSCYVSTFLCLTTEATRLDNVGVCCFLFAAALQDVFELSSLTYGVFVLKVVHTFWTVW